MEEEIEVQQLSNLPKVIHLVSDGIEIQTRAF